MTQIDPKQKIAILRALHDASTPIGSAAIAEELQSQGIDLSSRTIRLYLQEMEQRGWVEEASRGRNGGRTITAKGAEEIKDAMITARLGFAEARVDALAAQMTFNPVSRTGLVVVNISTIGETSLMRAMDVMVPVFRARLSMGEYMLLARPGETVGRFRVPEGRVAIGTVCSVTVNGVLLASRIPMTSRFGGVLEMEGGKPARFTDVINYDGTSLDPLEIFIKGRLLSVRDTAAEGKGRIGASFREIPTCTLDEAEKTLRRLDRVGLDGVVMLGKPNQPLLDFPVHNGRTGLIIMGGLNPAAALEEAGIPCCNFAMSTLYDFEKLVHYREAALRVAAGEYAPRRPAEREVRPVQDDWLVD